MPSPGDKLMRVIIFRERNHIYILGTKFKNCYVEKSGQKEDEGRFKRRTAILERSH